MQTPPHADLKRYDALREMGVNRVSFCFEIFDPCVFKEVCPGKDRQYGLQRYLDAVEYCASLGKKGPRNEPWVTNGEIIVGLEPPESSIKAIDWITSVGAIPTVCVFRPLAGTDYADVPPPQTEPLIPVFRRLYEACMEKGLPIGVAPNIHVSLVLLPGRVPLALRAQLPAADPEAEALRAGGEGDGRPEHPGCGVPGPLGGRRLVEAAPSVSVVDARPHRE